MPSGNGNGKIMGRETPPVVDPGDYAIAHPGVDPIQPYAHRAHCMLVRFDYACPWATDYEHSEKGLQAFLSDARIKHFTAREVMSPANPKALGDNPLAVLPPLHWFPRAAAVLALGDKLRIALAEPIRLRWLYRAGFVNRTVGGADDSDHLYCLAGDYAFQSRASQELAQKNLLDLQENEPWLRLSLGLNGRGNVTHVGLLTKHGRRKWDYSTMGKE